MNIPAPVGSYAQLYSDNVHSPIKHTSPAHVVAYDNTSAQVNRFDTGYMPMSKTPVGIKPKNIWSAFTQGKEGNCVTISAIKAAMMKYGHNPRGIYKSVTETPTGFDIVMRDTFKLSLTHDEIKQAKTGSAFYGDDPDVLADAVFLYAASAKRAQMKNHEGRAKRSFEAAMGTLNDGEGDRDGFKRLGLLGKTRWTHFRDLDKGVTGTASFHSHSVAVVDGHIDLYGEKRPFSTSPFRNWRGMYLKLV
ncbi:hypothetical protein PSH61_01215 [Pseudomonas rhodesiae]|uniref:hypothetical protein n=1 Tax=Pseudomonas rhodesiae TaxID=76760 RepID=UPI00273440A4|nr:hypothetical protein [Pseudomonas rhodesiae]WLI29753.1 hypothetical protein PSH61_01215 [Pseudomonas rhodesiae]